MRIRKSDLSSIHENREIRAELASYKAAAKRGDGEGGCLCFCLGFFFSVIGILIAAMIGKRAGVVSALWGFIVGSVVGGIGWVFLVMLGS